MIQAVIIDDEPNNVANLVQLLGRHCPQVSVAATAYDTLAGQKVIADYRPDLVFLDISMPGQTGFDLLHNLPAIDFDVIFVTAFNQYGIQAVKFSALDYLLKPINPAELRQAVEKAFIRKETKLKNDQLENLLQLLRHQQDREEHRIALPGAKETRFIRPAQVIRCESSNNYTTFYLAGGEKWIVSRPMYEYDELLKDYGFIRCHQSHLVNKKYIRSWVKEDGGYLLLEDNTPIPVSRGKRELIREWVRH
jgi:two-component system, LytTR family, response regulator